MMRYPSSMHLFILILLLAGVSHNVTAQDIIYKENGQQVKAKVKEITEVSIKYKRYDHLEGPLRNIPKREVFMIIYENGKREKFVSEKPKDQKDEKGKKPHPETAVSEDIHETPRADNQGTKDEKNQKHKEKEDKKISQTRHYWRVGTGSFIGNIGGELINRNQHAFNWGFYIYDLMGYSDPSPWGSFLVGYSYYLQEDYENSTYINASYGFSASYHFNSDGDIKKGGGGGPSLGYRWNLFEKTIDLNVNIGYWWFKYGGSRMVGSATIGVNF